MKIKCCPEDFVVEELAEPSASGGPFTLYRLWKRGLGTPEAIAAVCSRWGIQRGKVSFGGLKDRHAETMQWITILGGPRRDLAQGNLAVKYEGRRPAPFTPGDIAGNRFRIVVRDLDAAEVARAEKAFHEAAREGVPNYFDQQRFGSVGVSGDFVARAWCADEYERALWLALAEAHPHDRSAQKSTRTFLRQHWGDWPLCLERLARTPAGGALKHLAARPTDFRGALAEIDADQRSLFLAAFQSHVWNCLLTAWLREALPAEAIVPAEIAGYEGVFFRNLTGEQQALLDAQQIPLPSARMRGEMDPAWIERTEKALSPLGLSLDQMKIKRLRETFFSKGSRTATYRPQESEIAQAPDVLHTGRTALQVCFTLPRGAYATILVRRVTL